MQGATTRMLNPQSFIPFFKTAMLCTEGRGEREGKGNIGTTMVQYMY